MGKRNLFDTILFISVLVTVLISGYMTYLRLAYHVVHTSYDAWLFGMNLALLIQIYDAHDSCE